MGKSTSDPNGCLRAGTESVLSEAFGSRCLLGEEQVLKDVGGSRTVRFPVADAGGGVPASVISKRFAAGATGDRALANESTVLEFLARVAGDRPIAPKPYGVRRGDRILVTEDVGPAEMGALLNGDDVEAASQAAIAYLDALGDLHARTMGRQGELESLRRSAGLPSSGFSVAAMRDLPEGALSAATARALSEAGVDAPAGLADDLACIEAFWCTPSDFQALVHQDPGLDNFVVGARGSRLIDFEFAGFHHALIDACFVRMPMGREGGRFPESLARRMEDAYWQRFARALPDWSRERFERLMVEAYGYVVAGLCCWALSNETQASLAAVDRQHVMHRLRWFASAAGRVGHLPALSDAAEELAVRLRLRWHGVDEMPVFPVFQAGEDPTPHPQSRE